MPCATEQNECRSSDDPVKVSSRFIRRRAAETRLACDRCRQLETNGGVPEWATEWWELHKVIDDERIATEAEAARTAKVRKSALAKLTAEEREELGV
jgi:hypothetical protein